MNVNLFSYQENNAYFTHMNRVFVELMKSYRTEKNYSIAAISVLAGLSTKYLYSIENLEVASEYEKKNISLKKLRDIILLLAMQDIFEVADREYTIDFGEMGEYDKLPHYSDIRLHIIKEMAFASLGLESYSNRYKEIISDSEWWFIKRERIKKNDYDNAELWAFGDHSTFQSLKDVAQDIIIKQIKHRFFVGRRFNLTEARQTIKEDFKFHLSQADNETQRFWKRQQLQNFVSFYVLPDINLLNDFRLIVTDNNVLGFIEMVPDNEENRIELIAMGLDDSDYYFVKLKELMKKIDGNKHPNLGKVALL